MVTKLIHVAVAALVHSDKGQVFITKRPDHVHLGGLWEFPGGKVESGELVLDALHRELWEETGIRIESARPLIKIPYAYPDKIVLLDVYRVTRWQGEPHGREGQASRWITLDNMDPTEFPAADKPIITALRLSSVYLITPEPGADRTAFLARLESCVAAGVRLVQFRAKTLDVRHVPELGVQAMKICHAYGAKLLINSQPEIAIAIGADGVHLSSKHLLAFSDRPEICWVAASCHNEQELMHAQAIGADFAVVSPVHRTASHPEAAPLGWECFASMIEDIRIPVYALGGMAVADLPLVWQHGGQGIAALRGIWDAGDDLACFQRML
jgi:8-oxo-dGTP diphosphatase